MTTTEDIPRKLSEALSENGHLINASPVSVQQGNYSASILQKNNIADEWENLTITSDFIFFKVVNNERFVGELIHRILPTLQFSKIQVVPQKAVEAGLDIHGVRFDVFVTLNTGERLEIEMQVVKREDLPKRTRYYGSMMDTEVLEKGMPYSKLPESYVILICPFDLYGKGRHIYTFTNRCKEDPTLEMKDGMTKIVLNAFGTEDDVNPRLKAFLDYVAGKPVDDEFVQELDEAVKAAKQNKEWRREYMALKMRDLENQEIGRKEGREEGREEGYEKRDRVKIAEMLQNGRSPESIADFCSYPIELVKEVEASIKANL